MISIRHHTSSKSSRHHSLSIFLRIVPFISVLSASICGPNSFGSDPHLKRRFHLRPISVICGPKPALALNPPSEPSFPSASHREAPVGTSDGAVWEAYALLESALLISRSSEIVASPNRSVTNASFFSGKSRSNLASILQRRRVSIRNGSFGLRNLRFVGGRAGSSSRLSFAFNETGGERTALALDRPVNYQRGAVICATRRAGDGEADHVDVRGI